MWKGKTSVTAGCQPCCVEWQALLVGLRLWCCWLPLERRRQLRDPSASLCQTFHLRGAVLPDAVHLWPIHSVTINEEPEGYKSGSKGENAAFDVWWQIAPLSLPDVSPEDLSGRMPPDSSPLTLAAHFEEEQALHQDTSQQAASLNFHFSQTVNKPPCTSLTPTLCLREPCGYTRWMFFESITVFEGDFVNNIHATKTVLYIFRSQRVCYLKVLE